MLVSSPPRLMLSIPCCVSQTLAHSSPAGPRCSGWYHAMLGSMPPDEAQRCPSQAALNEAYTGKMMRLAQPLRPSTTAGRTELLLEYRTQRHLHILFLLDLKNTPLSPLFSCLKLIIYLFVSAGVNRGSLQQDQHLFWDIIFV